MNIGFVGLGAMGQAMAHRLIAAGHDLHVWNRTRSKADALVAQGAHLARTPAELASRVEIVFSMLFDDATTEAVTFGEDGIAQGMTDTGLHICCSTLSLAQARRLRDGHDARGQAYISANVLGRPPAAADGTLYIIAAGKPERIARAEPVLDCLGQTLFRVGEDPVQANLVKLSLNFMIYTTIEQMAEIFTLNEKFGTDPAKVFEIMTNSFYTAPVHRNYGGLMVKHDYDHPGAPVTLGLKDIEMFLGAGGEQGVPLPFASIMRDRLIASVGAGDAERDFVVLQERIRQESGLAPR
ncbi:NAD(P)-dependent oxidoreductase [Swaminathania salitolerans]|uniref:3-hydroxyisobutyrate dehydrogenase n=1 Tax=Swaminathania salitolerans TaxID=182838 RepID=A0A511BSY4_9PROT|nr:NAD(P)-dependent oxidoreductase [Swaminathania salitolerans]GBQ14152.1 oxidoreductase [Swaminathania salitolerans LMG 21291]GEL02933.1 3-hydroxyisobutyrate dehydrogenase [Swaminathania salitolerans]